MTRDEAALLLIEWHEARMLMLHTPRHLRGAALLRESAAFNRVVDAMTGEEATQPTEVRHG